MSGCCMPPYSGIEPGWDDGWPAFRRPIVADQWNEYVEFNIPPNTFVATIPFQVVKASNKIIPRGLVVVNQTDDPQLIISFNITNISTSGITILLDQQVTTANYYINGLWSVVG